MNLPFKTVAHPLCIIPSLNFRLNIKSKKSLLSAVRHPLVRHWVTHCALQRIVVLCFTTLVLRKSHQKWVCEITCKCHWKLSIATYHICDNVGFLFSICPSVLRHSKWLVRPLSLSLSIKPLSWNAKCKASLSISVLMWRWKRFLCFEEMSLRTWHADVNISSRNCGAKHVYMYMF